MHTYYVHIHAIDVGLTLIPQHTTPIKKQLELEATNVRDNNETPFRPVRGYSRPLRAASG